MIKYLYILIVLMLGINLSAQRSISFSLVSEKNKIEIGDELNVSMRVTFPSSIAPSTIQFPVLEEGLSINDTIDVLKVQPSKSESGSDNQGNPNITWQQNFTVGIYAGGNIEVGPFQIIIGAGETADTILSNVATISVSTPELQEDKGFVGIKGIEEDPFSAWEKFIMWLKEYWLWILIPIVVIIGTIFLIKFINKKPEERRAPVPVLPLPIVLLNKLEKIDEENLWQQGNHKAYYSDVTDVIRRFLEYKYQIATLEKTSDEILNSLTLSSINKNDYNQLKNLFSLATMIKFAKSMPMAEENIQAMTIAKGLINKEIRKLK